MVFHEAVGLISVVHFKTDLKLISFHIFSPFDPSFIYFKFSRHRDSIERAHSNSLFIVIKLTQPRVVVVAQLAERSLPIPEDPGSNPAIGNLY